MPPYRPTNSNNDPATILGDKWTAKLAFGKQFP